VHNRPAVGFAREIRRGIRRGIQAARAVDRRTVMLRPEGSPRGNVLLSYVIDGFFQKEISVAHTQVWEAVQMARTWVELGYRVDVIDNSNVDYRPTRDYDFFVSARMTLEPIGRRLNDDCVKILHIDTAHWLFHETAQHRRLLDLQRRKGVTLQRLRPVGRNRAIEFADCATILGNDFTAGTYAYAGKQLYRVPISSPRLFPWPERKDFEACRRRFLWFGGYALVHKGLDLVLDAFAGMPDLDLVVAGRVDDPEFEAVYKTELRYTPSIDAIGWIDLRGTQFTEVANRCIALVYPTCSEGGGGSAIACMHAGLIPIVSREASVDVDESFGIILESSTIEEIRAAVRELAARPAPELERMARRAWEFAREHHTRERFAREYRNVALQIMAAYRPEHVEIGALGPLPPPPVPTAAGHPEPTGVPEAVPATPSDVEPGSAAPSDPARASSGANRIPERPPR
jgi:glycosyltransferase involved in cell wall biosynthesis